MGLDRCAAYDALRISKGGRLAAIARSSIGIAGIGLVAACLGCASGERTPERGSSERVLAAQHLMKAATHISPALLARTAAGFELAKPGYLRTVLPTNAASAVRLEMPREGFWVEVRAEDGALNGEAAKQDAALVYPDVLRHTDIVWFAAHDRAEEIRLLRDAEASPVARWRIRTGPGVATIRLRDERIELVAPDGYVALSTDPMDAVDARGSRRSLHVELEARGHDAVITARLDTAGLSYPIAVDPVWTTVPSMSVKRSNAAAALLPSGKVIVTGGSDWVTAPHKLTELYDPATNTWTKGPPMLIGRLSAAATVLPTGKVLVGGGDGGSATQSSTELYDPVAGTWLYGAAYSIPRRAHGQTLLGTGKVLAVGGAGTTDSSAEVYDPAANVWTATANKTSLAQGNYNVAALKDGKALAIGADRVADLYDPMTNRWTPAGTAPTSGCSYCNAAGLAALLDGRALAVIATGKAALFDPATSVWTSTVGSMTAMRGRANTVRLLGGKVLLPGDFPGDGCELFDPATGSFFATGSLATKRRDAITATLLNTGAVLVTGGNLDGTTYSSAELYRSEVGGACVNGSECASGFCVDSVCCDSACTGQCEACDVVDPMTKTAGRCVPITGAPHGTRSSCSTTGADPCQAPTCDGVVRTSCAGKSVDGTECRPASCTDGKRTIVARCAGGSCPPIETGSCDGYACKAAECGTTCATAGDCIAGYVCKDTRCTPRTASCTSDGLGSIPKDGGQVSCAPYRCAEDGTCASACAGSSDCAPGFVCDPTNKSCVTAGAPDEDDGGCAFGRRGGAASGLLLGLLAIGIARRRRG